MRKTNVRIIIIKRRSMLLLLAIFALALLLTIFAVFKGNTQPTFNSNSAEYNTVMKRDLLCLMTAYWQYVKGVEKKPDGSVYLIMQSGLKILYDDKKVKSNDEKLKNSDLQDMLEQTYPLYSVTTLMPIEFNPGRNRVYSLFKDMYGQSKEKIEANLTGVRFGNQALRFNRNNNASVALKEIDSELLILTKNLNSAKPFVYPSSGTYSYRNIAGTNLLSTHSFGTAIDLAANGKDYWQWASKSEGMKRIKVYPPSVVKVFEDNNFIWGGKWGYFDLMHYEYRPELILKAKYFSKMPGLGQPWYIGSPYPQDTHVRTYVQVIDEALK